MSRARATALILVNWKGVFFERYWLDRHVTALEGANGAGKTTVMIAAYVVLLPDLTRLKFTNLGETGATGGDRGIWGRLGEPGPSYAALEIELEAGERLLAGVYLERKTAPALSLTTFVVSGLPSELTAQRIFLCERGTHEHVATMEDIAASVAAAGATLEVFSSVKDYFSSLFERGVSPLRLSLEEERNKFNDMLRTSMTGGISRTLTSDLRSFLFKQQTGLFDTLSRMRKNLEACRRTRLEVVEARVLEHEINGIYAAGHAMFEAALDASRQEAMESRRALTHAEQAFALELGACQEYDTARREAELRKDSLAPRVERAREAEALARLRLSRVTRALGAAERLRNIEAEQRHALPEMATQNATKAAAASAREHAKKHRDQAQQTQLLAAAGLASLQAGLEELHRQADAERRVREKLAAARDALEQLTSGEPTAPDEPAAHAWLRDFARLLRSEADPGALPALSAELLSESLRRIKQQLSELDRTRAERDRQAEVAERRRQDQLEARAALHTLCGEPVESELAARARQELARLNELELLASQLTELGASCARLTERAERQSALYTEVRALGGEPLPSAREFVQRVGALEAQLRAREHEQREHEASAKRQLDEELLARAKERELAARSEAYQRLAAVASRLESTGLALPPSRAELSQALRASNDARHALQTRANELDHERQAALALALETEVAEGGPQAELARLAELVDGQLLSARYEDLDVDAARRTQAELGPLAQAIVVEDPSRALPLLLTEPHEQADLWLLQAGAAWPLSPPDSATARLLPAPDASPARVAASTTPAPQVVVDLGYGLRITRLPQTVSLGRAARQRRAERLRADAEAASRAMLELDARQRDQEKVSRDLETLQEHWESWAGGDPAPQIERCREDIAAANVARQREQELARELRVEAARLGAKLEAYRAQLGDHHLLDPPDYTEEAERARQSLNRAKGAAAELERTKRARRVLIGLMHELGDTPPTSSELETWHRERTELEAQRDRLFAAAEALAVVDAERAALTWTDAERALRERTELVPELEAQHERALRELEGAQLDFEKSEALWEQVALETQVVSARLAAIDAHLARAQEELRADGVEDPSPDALAQAARDVEHQTAILNRLQSDAGSIDAELALGRERLGESEKRRRAAELALSQERKRAEPREQSWQALWNAAQKAGVFDRDGALDGAAPAASSSQRWLEAQSKRELLADRLEAARGGSELLPRISAPSNTSNTSNAHASSQTTSGAHHLELWLQVRAWLMRRLPAPVAELGEPLLGLSRLKSDLRELEGRLDHQEGELRGTSTDVARSIDVQLRRASLQVKRLNRALEGVSFGSIHAIRVQLERVDKMDQVLRALREGETQELLFQSNLPIEDALDEIFRRHGGGRTGGQKLVDYREYLELFVQIQRRPEQAWERVNPSQVSTGEAIGIGAALMMVILSEWERDDQLLRRERRVGSLRFLFLDEANRLSQDNLGVLFDLCQGLDLQLLIAAPEVARAEGNTTYRLVRRVSEDGREEVLVTGRRATLPDVRPVEPVGERVLEATAPVPVQLGLL